MNMQKDPPRSDTTGYPGQVIDFSNGGRIIVQFVQDGQVFFATWHPRGGDPILRRMTFEDFDASLEITRKECENAYAA